MRIGIITAMAEETLPVHKKIGQLVDATTISGVEVFAFQTGKDTLYLARSGVGEIRAAAATQLLCDVFDVEFILNFGFVGALNPSLEIGEMVLCQKAVHSAFDLSRIDGTPIGQYDNRDGLYFQFDDGALNAARSVLPYTIKLVTIASSDEFVAGAERKAYLRTTFGADICDMESAGIMLTAERNGVPVLSFKVVSDKADGSAGADFAETVRTGMTKYEEYIPSVLRSLDAFAAARSLPPAKR